ncbi:MAG: alpha/beta hydrolase [Woeseiaceae bacterium]
MASREMQAFREGLSDAPKKIKLASIDEQRAEADRFMSAQKVPADVLIDDYTLAGRPARKYFTEGVREDATSLYLHGGGYTVCSLDSHQSFMAHLAIACETAVNGLDYRLAPENPYPAALDDAVAAYKEMTAYTAGDKIMIAGDSAGGGLALACVLRIKDEGLPMPGCVALLSPVTDQTGSGKSLGAARDEFMKGAALYAGDFPLDTIGISPLFGDMSGLPPMLIQVASDEALLDDSTRLEKRASEAGVAVELQMIDDALHVYQIFTHLPESRDALAEIGAFYKRHI